MRHGAPRRLVALGAVLAATVFVTGASPAAVAPGTIKRAATVQIVGHGWGAGIGLGQWGAFGYAVKYHFGYERILNRYYGQTTSATLPTIGRPANPTMRVLVLENLNLANNVGYDPVVTSSSGFSVVSSGGVPTPSTTTLPGTTVPTTTAPTTTAPTTTAPTTTAPVTTAPATSVPSLPPSTLSVSAGTAVDLRLQTNGTWTAFEAPSCAASLTATVPVATGLINPVVNPATLDPSAGRASLLTLCRHDGVDEPLRGQIEAYDRSGFERTINLVPLESYLQGVVPAESSASWGSDGSTVGAPQGEPWGFQALEAQAVAARSYAVAYAAAGGWNGYADICDTTQCQAYVGATYETPVSNASIVDTANEVRITQDTTAGPTVVSTRFSASSGGWTAPGAFPAVQDFGDGCVVVGNPLECNPNHTWTASVSASVVNKAFPSIGRLLRIRVTSRNHHGQLGGRSLEVRLTGTKQVLEVTGNAFAAVANLKSDWFAVAKVIRVGAPVAAASTTAPPVVTTTTTTLPTTPAGGTTGASGANGTVGSSGAVGSTGAASAPSTTATTLPSP